ncbi:RidA family protein [Paenibacillus sp. sgz302251]|uniref:RidA family protein n=1 Tax=Paenibacillus sp. sgz302251 TaxID=3414493 RepID=UPI003C7DD582
MRKVIHSDKAPAAVGPYSQGIQIGNMIFASGQLPLDPATGNTPGDDVVSQTVQALENLREVLAAAGAGFEDVVKTTVYMRDLNDFAEVNRVYGSYFNEEPPARVCIEISRMPRDVLVEIDAIAILSVTHGEVK